MTNQNASVCNPYDKDLKRWQSKYYVLSGGIEPPSQASETCILSVVLRDRTLSERPSPKIGCVRSGGKSTLDSWLVQGKEVIR